MPFVYFIHEDGCYDTFKVGKTQNHPADRLEQLQTGNPRRLRIYRWIKITDHSTAEEYIHARFHKKHVLGEWFSVTPDDIDEECAIIASGDPTVEVSGAWQRYTEDERVSVKLERKAVGRYRGAGDPRAAFAGRRAYQDKKSAELALNLVGFSDD